ncbi:hypothetical protein SDC9_43948 [bioreactor metagenome]|uniref:DUF1795 domain-containing protein n=1 Tax=bioreactor metagenome TaxID=1076179 RepID=A0A644W5R0_9ZZZZ
MKKSILSFFLLFASIVLLAQTKYSSPLGNFQITFPGTPEYSNSNVDISDGTIRLHMFIYSGENEIFMVACADYPDGYIGGQENHKTFIDNAAEGFFGELNIVAGNRKDVKCKKYKGAEFSGQGNEYGVIYRVYIAKNTVFQVAIMATNSYPEAKAASAFFKSFKITI